MKPPLFLVPPAASPSAGRLDALDRAAVDEFVLTQHTALRAALATSDDDPVVDAALALHDASHQSWIALIAAVGATVGEEAARAVSGLYAFHGEVAGRLERCPDPRLSPTVRAEVRALLDTRLVQLTKAAFAALQCPAGPLAAAPSDA